jgi:hypothetical protein
MVVGTLRTCATYQTRILAANPYAATSMRTVIWGVNEPWLYGVNLAYESDGRACPDLTTITRQPTTQT